MPPRKTDADNCTFLLTLRRSLRTQLKQFLSCVEAEKGKTIYPNKAINYLMDKALGNELDLNDPDIRYLEEAFYGIEHEYPVGGTADQNGEAAETVGLPEEGVAAAGGARRRPRG